MHSTNPIPLLSLLLLFFSFPTISLSDPRITEASFLCGSSPTPNDSISFVSNFVSNMESLSQQVSTHKWGTNITGTTSSSPVYGLFQCHSDLSQADCLRCFSQCRTRIPRCLSFASARIFLDGCFLRYDNYSFFHEHVDDKKDNVTCSRNVVEDENDRLKLGRNVEETVRMVVEMTMKGEDGFGVGESRERGVVGVYGLGQCWRSLRKEDCRVCLEKAGKEVRRKCLNEEGRGLNVGCYLRYSTEKFYGQTAGSSSEGEGSSRKRIIIAVTSSVAFVTLLSILGVYIGYRRLAKAKQVSKHLGKFSTALEKSGLNFKYETLEKAADYFSPSRKLGQGASGSVYKGILQDGRIIAVKRLFFTTRQWVDEFFNEVNLISGVQHKNLVKLLGCSIEGPESILVYEYVPNKSLDDFLFDKNKTHSLSWQQRFDIIVGIAEGLAYLHEGSTKKIIHRDIKTSNILLDENLKAKIADFGLIRCVEADKSHLSTGIAGTLGYMAPEYLVRGQLTEKADVYSFGVLVLEIVCGRKNSVYMEESSSILHVVWKHYKSSTLPETVDECLRDYFPAKVASNVLQIGLLCTQASASLRPSMSEVVQMLTDEHCSIPLPMQPPFLNARLINPNSSVSISIPSSAPSATIDGFATSASDLR